MAASSTRMRKQALEDVPMHVHRVRGSKSSTVLAIGVEIPLARLKNDTRYWQMVGPASWNLQVVRGKKRTTLTLCTKTSPCLDVVCFVKYDKFFLSEIIRAERPSFDAYEFAIPSKAIENPANALLTYGGRLGFILEACMSVGAPVFHPHVGGRGMLDQSELLTELQESVSYAEARFVEHLVEKSARALFTDFALRTADGKVVRVHRSILAVRSGFFRDLLQKNPEMVSFDLSYPECLVQQAVFFMYYSQIYECTPDLVSALLLLSEDLDINNLKDMCLNYIKIHSADYQNLGRGR